MAAPTSRYEMVQCPYDKEHMVMAGRYPQHIVKCREKYMGDDYVTCSFNAGHIVLKREISWHIANCPDRELLEKDIYYEEQLLKGKLKTGDLSVPNFDLQMPELVENWDDDDDQGPLFAPDTPKVSLGRYNGAVKSQQDEPKLENMAAFQEGVEMRCAAQLGKETSEKRESPLVAHAPELMSEPKNSINKVKEKGIGSRVPTTKSRFFPNIVNKNPKETLSRESTEISVPGDSNIILPSEDLEEQVVEEAHTCVEVPGDDVIEGYHSVQETKVVKGRALPGRGRGLLLLSRLGQSTMPSVGNHPPKRICDAPRGVGRGQAVLLALSNR